MSLLAAAILLACALDLLVVGCACVAAGRADDDTEAACAARSNPPYAPQEG